MKKVIEFTEAEKSLIWATIVNPVHGTPDDAQAFVLVCEEYGLNPLTGDIVFKRYETKNGPKVSYTVTRDGYLKHAYRQSDFISINAGVVRQGDHFKFDLNREVVEHDFNSERGPVIGAWSVLKTKNRGNVMDFTDYNEYKEALGPKNDLWYKMPSAMIKKVAQSTVIRMAFPLGVIFQSEDEIDRDENNNIADYQAQSKDVAQNEEQAAFLAELQQAKEEAETSSKAQKAEEKSKIIQKPIPEKQEQVKEETPKVSTVAEEKEVVQKDPPVAEITKEATVPAAEEVPTDSAEIAQEENVQNESVAEKIVSIPANKNAYVFIESTLQESPGSKKKFLTIRCTKEGVSDILLAADDAIYAFDEFTAGIAFEPTIKEQNGFKFVESVKVVA